MASSDGIAGWWRGRTLAAHDLCMPNMLYPPSMDARFASGASPAAAGGASAAVIAAARAAGAGASARARSFGEGSAGGGRGGRLRPGGR